MLVKSLLEITNKTRVKLVVLLASKYIGIIHFPSSNLTGFTLLNWRFPAINFLNVSYLLANLIT